MSKTIDIPDHDLMKGDLTNEAWREYDFNGRIYRINEPQYVMFHKNGTTHRVVDLHNTVHCLPAPGHCGCALRWLGKKDHAVDW